MSYVLDLQNTGSDASDGSRAASLPASTLSIGVPACASSWSVTC